MKQITNRFSFEPPRYTFKDYEKWSDEWELIEGYPYSLMPSAGREHQDFGTNFTYVVKSVLLGKSCDCQLYYEYNWIVKDNTIVRPDAMIVCGKFKTKWLTFPPALILEIASDSTADKDRNEKFKTYESNGIKYYLMVDPIKRSIECYELVDSNYQLKKDNKFIFHKGCEVEIDFDKIWQLS